MPTYQDRVKQAIDAYVPPHLRDYFYRMTAKEGISGKDSPTGARGPLQFTRGTGKAYGLVGPQGDIRGDIDANIKAGVPLTINNAATLRRHLGREPTNSELALAHQQGDVTAAKMLTGTGNASAANLRANNVNPNLPPQAAAQQIMNYYGFDKGTTLNNAGMFNPSAPGAFAAPTAGAVPYAGGFTPPTTPGVSLGTTPVPAAPATFAERVLGADQQGGKDTPFAKMMPGLDDIAKGLKRTPDPTLNQIAPSSAGAVDQRIASTQPLAQSMLTQMIQSMQARRGMR